jgi:indole-3-glycerol phosphate synthase
MKETFLQIAVKKARHRAADLKTTCDLAGLERAAADARSHTSPFRLEAALASDKSVRIIAELKRASPSRGNINTGVDICELAGEYEMGGAVAVSVLTEPEYFQGSIDDLRAVRSVVKLPLLRKDFIVDEIQILEAAAAGADAVLLIVAALSVEKLDQLIRFANELDMDSLVEVHNRAEMEIGEQLGARIIGVNNRDLSTLKVSLDVSRDLIGSEPPRTLMVAESGITTKHDIEELGQMGFDGFLIGEALMRDSDPRSTLQAWLQQDLTGSARAL